MNSATARTIFHQIGGVTLITMTGAKDFVADADRLQFRLPARFAAKSINHVSITLDASDTYTVRFSSFRKLDLRPVSEFSNVYASDLRSLFTAETGLDTSMGRIAS